MAELTTYDEVPYDSRPRYATHPDCLATVGILRGMKPARISRCRVLELGCASGGNLLDLAESYPESRFVGIDLSARQIETGQKLAAALGLSNLELRRASLSDLEDSAEPFDYIIAHGVYSWVSAPVRDDLLRRCRELLAPQGIAYVSYNTLPGWHLRAPVREILNFHVRDLEGAAVKVGAARQLLDFLLEGNEGKDTLWARMLQEEANIVRPEGDFYIYHEHLSPDNHACYFHEFMAHARQHRLQYLGEAGPHMGLPGVPSATREILTRYSPDPLLQEQYVDFMINRAFRRTLLVREEVPLAGAFLPEVLPDLSVCGMVRPCSANPDVRSSTPEEFTNEEGLITETAQPLAKAALLVLFEHWPQALPFGTMCRLAVERLGMGADALTGHVYLHLARALIHLFSYGLAGLHVELPPFVTHVSDRPRTTPLLRLQARHLPRVCNRRHRLVEMAQLDRGVLALLDGTRQPAAIVEELIVPVQRGEVKVAGPQLAGKDTATVRAALQEAVTASLERLASVAVLVG